MSNTEPSSSEGERNDGGIELRPAGGGRGGNSEFLLAKETRGGPLARLFQGFVAWTFLLAVVAAFGFLILMKVRLLGFSFLYSPVANYIVVCMIESSSIVILREEREKERDFISSTCVCERERERERKSTYHIHYRLWHRISLPPSTTSRGAVCWQTIAASVCVLIT